MTPQAPITGDEVADGWIAWAGGAPCPVDPDTLVQVQYRDGRGRDWIALEAAYWSSANPVTDAWIGDGTSFGDIVAYRVLRSAATAARQQGVGK